MLQFWEDFSQSESANGWIKWKFIKCGGPLMINFCQDWFQNVKCDTDDEGHKEKKIPVPHMELWSWWAKNTKSCQITIIRVKK
jgi:hypothetical protein